MELLCFVVVCFVSNVLACIVFKTIFQDMIIVVGLLATYVCHIVVVLIVGCGLMSLFFVVIILFLFCW